MTSYRERKKEALSRVERAQRDALAAKRELEMVRALRARANRIVYELGVHERKNNFVGIVHSVARGLQ